MQNQPKKFFIFGIIALLALAGCAAEKPQQTATAVKPAAAKAAPQAENVLKGKIAGKSNKAKTISIVVGKGEKAKTVMLKFDDATKGLDVTLDVSPYPRQLSLVRRFLSLFAI